MRLGRPVSGGRAPQIRIGVGIRSALTTIVFEKSLRISAAARQGSSTGGPCATQHAGAQCCS